MNKIIETIRRVFYAGSIKKKMMLIIMSVSLVGILTVAASILINELINLKKIQQINLEVLADVVADTSTAYLVFGDELGAATTLGALKAKQQITKAIIFNQDETQFAAYLRQESKRKIDYAKLKNEKSIKGGISAWQNVVSGNEIVGYLYLESDNSLVDEFIESAVIGLIFIVSIGALIAYFLASILQRVISEPIEHLTVTASLITAQEDFSLRAEKESDDEVGVLTGEFNKMLAQIQLRNQALLESENRFREVVEQSVDALFLLNSEGGFIDVNNAACKSLGYEREELLKSSIIDVDKNINSRADIDKLLNKLEAETMLDYDSEHERKNGEMFPVDVRLGYVNTKSGRLVLGSARDITERKQAQDELQKANDMLEIKVNERTRELKNTNVELSIAKEKAEAANRAKSMFLANMSHEIRTPMNAVIGFTDVLASSDLNERQIGYVKSIQSGGRNLLSLINDILDLSKIEAGKMKIETAQVHIKNLLQDIEQVFVISAQEKGLDFELNIDKSVPDVILTDELRFRQILLNLINNAIKFTRHGGVKVFAEYGMFLKDELFSSLKISIKDTGIGIPDSDQKKIFNIFEQQDNQSTREFGGAGLGLAISTRLAERLGAEISVASKVGEGSCFELLLKSPEVGDKTTREAKKENILDIKFKPATILVVDDVEANRDLIGEYLANQPFKIMQALDGEQAISVINSNRDIDLVLMDVRMPKMGGVEATQVIKENQANKSLPIIAVTASVIEDKRADKKRSLFDAVLYKPLNRKNLHTCLKDFLEVDDVKKEEVFIADEARSLVDEMRKSGEKFYNDIIEYKPMLERAKNRGSFAGLDEMLDMLCQLATEFEMIEFKQVVTKLRTANKQFDIEETQKLLTKITTGISCIQAERP